MTRSFLPARREFRNFFAGRAGTVLQIATIPTEVGVLFSANTTCVDIEHEYAKKMLVKHRLTYEHLYLVQKAIDCGFCFAGKKANYLEFILFTSNIEGDDYKLVLKTAKWGSEVWFVTMHRTAKQQYRSMRRKQPLLRDHE